MKRIIYTLLFIIIVGIIIRNNKIKEYFSECESFEIIYYKDGIKNKIDENNLPQIDLLFIAGVHGNEYGPTLGIEDYLKENGTKLKGNLVFIPRVNISGIDKKVRYMDCLGENYNVNRHFKKNTNKFQKRILNLVNKSNITLDFHEAYDFHIINKNSIGSTIMVSNHNKLQKLGKILIDEINKTITDKNKKFIYLNNSKYDIKNSLLNYCKLNNKLYFLIEITGQNNKQPLELRKEQTRIILDKYLKYNGFI